MAKSIKHKKTYAIIWAVIYFALVVVIVVSGVAIFNSYYYRSIFVSGSSMEPTLNGGKNGGAEGDEVHFGIIDVSEQRINKIKRYDIVTTYYPFEYNNKKDYPLVGDEYVHGQTPNSTAEYKIKRIIALPGETFSIRKSKLYVYNEKTGEEEYIPYNFNIKTDSSIEYTGKDIEKKTLADDEYWALGDHRSVSFDCGSSKARHPIYKENIVGVLVSVQGTATIYTYYECPHCHDTFDKDYYKTVSQWCKSCSTSSKYYYLESKTGIKDCQYTFPRIV